MTQNKTICIWPLSEYLEANLVTSLYLTLFEFVHRYLSPLLDPETVQKLSSATQKFRFDKMSSKLAKTIARQKEKYALYPLGTRID